MERLRAERAGDDPEMEQFQPDLPKYEESYDDDTGEYYIGDLESGETVEIEETQNVDAPIDFSDVPNLFDDVPAEQP